MPQPITLYKYLVGTIHAITPDTQQGVDLLLRKGWSLTKREAMQKHN